MEVVATAPTGLSYHLKRKVSEMGDSLLGGTRTLFGWVDLNAGYITGMLVHAVRSAKTERVHPLESCPYLKQPFIS